MNNTIEKVDFTKNAVKFIQLYKKGSTWGFDEPALGLIFEPFILGASELLEYMIQNLETLENKETPQIVFAENLPDYDYKVYIKEDLGTSAWYTYTNKEGEVMDFYLCPCLTLYFSIPPSTICVKFKN